jgi:hypothetical protein
MARNAESPVTLVVAKDDEMIGSRVFHGQWSWPSLGMVARKPLVFGVGDGVCYAFDAITSASRSTGYLHRVWAFDCNTAEHRFRNGEPIDYSEGDKREDRGNNDDWSYLGLHEIISTPVFYKNRVYVAVGREG